MLLSPILKKILFLVDAPAKKALDVFLANIAEADKSGMETEVLIVTGYPRNLDDINEYTSNASNKNIAGVILLDWIGENANEQVERAVEIGYVKADSANVESRNKDLLDMTQFFRDQGNLYVVSLWN